MAWDRDEMRLAEAARRGNAAAYGELTRRNQGRIFALALRMSGSREAAEELTQEIFLRSFRRLRAFRGEARFSTWLHRIAVNTCLRHLEREKRLAFSSFPPVPEPAPEPALDPEGRMLREEVRIGCLTGLVRCLPGPQRAAFVLAVLLEIPDREVASILGCTPGAVKARLVRARRALADFLERRCHWIDGRNRCRCHAYVERALAQGLITRHPDRRVEPPDLAPLEAELDVLHRVVELYRSLPQPLPPGGLTARIRRGISDGEWRVLR